MFKEKPETFCFLLLGEEEFLKEEEIARIKAKYLKKETLDLNYNVFYARDKELDIKVVLDALNTLPFLSEKRVVIIKDIDELNPLGRELLASYLKSPQRFSCLILDSKSSKIQNGFLLEVSKHSKVIYCRSLRDEELDGWIFKRVRGLGKRITNEAVSVIKDNLSSDLMVISRLIENLNLYTGNRQQITKEDVERLAGKGVQNTTFELVDAIGSKDKSLAFQILSNLLKERKRETEILGFIAWHLKRIEKIKHLIKVRDKYAICRELNLNYRNFEKLSQQTKNFTTKRIRNLYNRLLDIDVAIKTGRTQSPSLLLEGLIVELCGGG